MPRIPQAEYARIHERVKVGGEKVAAVAASYGCTPANIYSILAKLRQMTSPAGTVAPTPAGPDPQLNFAAEAMAAADAAPLPSVPVAEAVPKKEEPAVSTLRAPARPVISSQSEAPASEASAPAPRSRDRASSSRGLKSSYALMMRTSDGEESMKPFRSLEDLLSAAKPILREAAHSPEPVWFSIQPIDRASLEDAF